MNMIGKAVTRFYDARGAMARAVFAGAPAANQAAETLARDGVVILPGALPAAQLEKVIALNRGRFDYSNAKNIIFSDDGKRLVNADTVTAAEFAKYYFLLQKNFNTVFDVYEYLEPVVGPILSAMYRSNWYFREVDSYRSQPVEMSNEYVGSFAWHRDNYPPGSHKVMLYLTDVTGVEDGPFTFSTGSHKGFYPELGKYGDRIPKEEVEGRLPVQPCLGPKGTIIVFNNNGVHRAANPKRGHREVVNALCLPSVSARRPPVNGTSLETEYTFIRKYTR